MHGVRSSSDQVTSIFLMSNFADGKNIQFTIHILLRPTLSITVTQTVVKAQGSLRLSLVLQQILRFH